MHYHMKKIIGLAVVAAAGMTFSSGARAASTPGGLGTEVPIDSRLARERFHYELPTGSPETLQIRDEVQRLHASHEAIQEMGKNAASSEDARVRLLAQRLSEEQQRIDWTLARVAQDSQLALTGIAYDTQLTSAESVVHSSEATGSQGDRAVLAGMEKLLDEQRATVDRLVPLAQDARRQALGSVLGRERSLIGEELVAVRALSAKVDGGTGGQG